MSDRKFCFMTLNFLTAVPLLAWFQMSDSLPAYPISLAIEIIDTNKSGPQMAMQSLEQ